ncbi:MAG: esterase [Myxococcota bacterium]|jgi:esterase
MSTLAYSDVTASGATPRRSLYILHGILGSGRNWRSFARRLVQAHPDWSAVLVDLRHHGDSPHLPAPHTLAACAGDVAALAVAIHRPPDAMIGHSFGGKVALTYAQRHGSSLGALGVLDSLPAEEGPPPDPSTNDVAEVLRVLSTLSMPAPARSDVRDGLRAEGLSEPLVQWLLTSLKRSGDTWGWAWRLEAIHALLDDYWRRDLWPFVAGQDRGQFHGTLTFVRAGRSDRWTSASLERFSALPEGSARLVTLPEAGHWLHVDDPDGTLAAVGDVLNRSTDGA